VRVQSECPLRHSWVSANERIAMPLKGRTETVATELSCTKLRRFDQALVRRIATLLCDAEPDRQCTTDADHDLVVELTDRSTHFLARHRNDLVDHDL